MTMSIGIPSGVILRFRVTRHPSQTYIFPLHLSDEILFQPLFYGTLIPVLTYFAVKKIIVEPWELRKTKAKLEKHVEERRIW